MRYRGRFRSSCEEDPRPIEEKKKAEGPSSRYLDTPGRRMKEGKDRTIRSEHSSIHQRRHGTATS